MLVGAFEIQVRREGRFGLCEPRSTVNASIPNRTTRRGCRGFLVLRGIRAEQFFLADCLPGFDAALLDSRATCLEQLRVRGCSSPVSSMQEERHRHAPLPLARERPVGPVLDHAVQPRLAPGQERTRCSRCRAAPSCAAVSPFTACPSPRTTASSRAGSPASCGASSAYSCACSFRPCKQHAALFQRLRRSSDSRPRSTCRRKAAAKRHIALAHHRREDLVVLHAVAAAGLEVLHAVSGRRCTIPVPVSRSRIRRDRPATRRS